MWAFAFILILKLQLGWEESTWIIFFFLVDVSPLFWHWLLLERHVKPAHFFSLQANFFLPWIWKIYTFLFSKFNSLARMCLKVYYYWFFLVNGVWFQSCRSSLYSNVYMISLFKYRFVIHLEFILVYGMRDGSNVIFLLMTIQVLFVVCWTLSAGVACRWCCQWAIVAGGGGVRDRGTDLRS